MMVVDVLIGAVGAALFVGFGVSMYKDFVNGKEKTKLMEQIQALQDKLASLK